MGFWDSVNEDLKKAVSGGWSSVKDNAKIGKLRLKVNSLHRQAGRHFSEIGGKVYEMSGAAGECKANPLDNPDVVRLIEEIRIVEAETRAVEDEIAAIRRGTEKEAAEQEKAPSGNGPGEEEESE